MKNNSFLTTCVLERSFVFSHRNGNERFYSNSVRIRRYSGTIDSVPILISGKQYDIRSLPLGTRVLLRGHFESFNHTEKNRRILSLYFFVEELQPAEEEFFDRNEALIQGYICKHPLYRLTPRGREITHLLLAVPRNDRWNDYIPVILWGKNARTAGALLEGDFLKIHGRIQSREYTKKLEDSSIESRTVYEISASLLESPSQTASLFSSTNQASESAQIRLPALPL